jgi:hypothetical protein
MRQSKDSRSLTGTASVTRTTRLVLSGTVSMLSFSIFSCSFYRGAPRFQLAVFFLMALYATTVQPVDMTPRHALMYVPLYSNHLSY